MKKKRIPSEFEIALKIGAAGILCFILTHGIPFLLGYALYYLLKG